MELRMNRVRVPGERDRACVCVCVCVCVCSMCVYIHMYGQDFKMALTTSRTCSYTILL